MKKAILIWLLLQLTVSAFAFGRVTVEQLNRVVVSSHGKSDGKIADRLFGLELAERLSNAKLADFLAALPVVKAAAAPPRRQNPHPTRPPARSNNEKTGRRPSTTSRQPSVCSRTSLRVAIRSVFKTPRPYLREGARARRVAPSFPPSLSIQSAGLPGS